MKARRLIEGASFGPDQLKIITAAFDDAWDQVEPTISGQADARESARLKLADVILRLASNGFRDAEQLADAALDEMSRPPTELK